MPRAIWKGAISFGLVYVPVALYPASQSVDIDFDWLDKRSMDPVGYKRINKRTGKEIEGENIVKGIKQKNGKYVILSENEIKSAYPKSTQSIDIDVFVNASEIPFTLLETPYYLEPLPKGEKVYALLREAMQVGAVIGARVGWPSERVAAVKTRSAALQQSLSVDPKDLYSCAALERSRRYFTDFARFGEVGAMERAVIAGQRDRK